MTCLDISDQLFREMGNPTDISIPAIVFYLKTNIGQLNDLIFSNYTITTSNSDISETFDDGTSVLMTGQEAAIFKMLYWMAYYSRKALQFLGAAGLQTALQVESDGANIRMVNKNEISKTYLQARKQQEDTLLKMVTSYLSLKSQPLQVAGDDTIGESPSHLYNNFYRTIFNAQ